MCAARIKWTPELDAKIKHATENGGITMLGEELGVSQNSIQLRRQRIGLQTTHKGFWSSEEIAVLREKWTEGLTGAQIGELMGKSRNSIIGKAHRLGLEYRGPTAGIRSPPNHGIRAPKPKKVRPPKPVTPMISKYVKGSPPKHYPAEKPITTKAPISIAELGFNTCRAIVGTGTDGLATYCGDMTFHDKPFCEGHCAMYYQTPEQRHRRRA